MKMPCLLLLTLLVMAATSNASDLKDVREDIVAKDVTTMFVELDLEVGSFRMSGFEPGDRDTVTRASGRFDEKYFDYVFDFDERGETGYLFFESNTRGRNWKADETENEWLFEFAPQLDISLRADIGAAEAIFDFADLSLSELELDIGAADAEVLFSTPNRASLEIFQVDAGACDLDIRKIGNSHFRELDFEGGVGSFLLDFTGDFNYEARADISVGLGAIEIILPDNVGIRLEVDDSWLSSVDFPEHRFERIRGDVYETDNYRSADGRLIISIDIGLGSADIVFE
jgi:hypothetical protein